MDEYIKAWCAVKVLSKVYGFGDPDGFRWEVAYNPFMDLT